MLGYNKTLNQFKLSGFNKYVQLFDKFLKDTIALDNFTQFDIVSTIFKSSSNNILNGLSGAGIFISMSEQLI